MTGMPCATQSSSWVMTDSVDRAASTMASGTLSISTFNASTWS